MNGFRSIRWQLQFWYGLFLLLLLAGFGLTAYRVERAHQFNRIDEELRKRVDALIHNRRHPEGGPPGAPKQGPPGSQKQGPPGKGPPKGNPPPVPPGSMTAPPRVRPLPEPNAPARQPGIEETARYDGNDGFYFAIWLHNGPSEVRSPGAPVDLPRPEGNEGGFRQRGDFREYFIVPAPSDSILVGRSIVPDLAELTQFAWLLTAAGAAVLAVGFLGGWWVVTRTIKPIEDISTTAVKIAAGDLSQRISVTGRGNEIEQLAGVLNSTFTRLDAAFAQQARFTADAAHELRTPVTVMLAHTQAALETVCTPEENRAAFEACQRAAQRMRKLIESLLELTRFDAGREPLRRQSCDLAEVAADSIDLLEPLAEERRITIHSDLASVPFNGDPDRLGQVFTNILNNAIHYNKVGGEVRVVTARTASQVTVSIIDNGPGIPPEHLPHIFERFYRADKARTSTSGRTGLGLAICQAIVEAHGGKITVSSEPGKGAAFCVELPAQL